MEVGLNKFFLVLFVTLATLMGTVACGALPVVALNDATATPTTRRIRPTFTPNPSQTPTEEATATEVPSDTPEPTDVPADTDTPEPTKAPTKKPAPPPAPKATKPPAPPPAPSFPVSVTNQHFCQQDGIYEIVLNAKQ